jgi:hypothetical protein
LWEVNNNNLVIFSKLFFVVKATFILVCYSNQKEINMSEKQNTQLPFDQEKKKVTAEAFRRKIMGSIYLAGTIINTGIAGAAYLTEKTNAVWPLLGVSVAGMIGTIASFVKAGEVEYNFERRNDPQPIIGEPPAPFKPPFKDPHPNTRPAIKPPGTPREQLKKATGTTDGPQPKIPTHEPIDSNESRIPPPKPKPPTRVKGDRDTLGKVGKGGSHKDMESPEDKFGGD